jgi:uncharacterized protein (TIGR00369 family)
VETPAAPDPSPPAPDPSDAGGHSFLTLLGARPIAFGQGRGRLELDVQPGHLRSLGLVHGGVVATLLDSVMGMAAASVAPPDHYVVTVGLNVHFIRPSRQGETLVASAEVVHSGRQTAVARGEIHTASGALVASGSATFLHLPHGGRARDPIGRIPDPGTEG